MSKETIEDLNRFQLVSKLTVPGADESYLHTGANGEKFAWHFQESLQQEDNSNHYDGFIPLADVEARLFNWEAVEETVTQVVPVDANVAPGLDVHDEIVTLYGRQYKLVSDPTRKQIVRSDDRSPLGVFRDGYTPHPYKEWLLDNVATILSESGGELGITSAGLLRNGGVAYVQVQPLNGTTIGGDTLVPLLTASGSFDGSLATSYTAGKYRAVCDNSLTAAVFNAEARHAYQHRGSATLKVAEAREQLGLFFEAQEEFDRGVEQFVNTKVTDDQFWDIVGNLYTPPADNASDRAKTNYLFRQIELAKLWSGEDPRVGDYAGTAWGAYQTFSTYEQHVGRFARSRDAGSRLERNKLNLVTGVTTRSDLTTVSTINKVLATV